MGAVGRKHRSTVGSGWRLAERPQGLAAPALVHSQWPESRASMYSATGAAGTGRYSRGKQKSRESR